ncbi:MAG TPA: DUF3368 domain-containing protein [Thermoplasmata archaeon]|nr:DUF3368 domain-containing protein [Thermoplasmata archaeon]
MRTWADASALIALGACGELSFLKDLFGRIYITEQVAREILAGKETTAMRDAMRDWIRVEKVHGDRRRWQALGLGDGEASLFLTPTIDRLILDERPARTVAEAEGREYTGLLGLILAAARTRRIARDRAVEIIRRLVAAGFHLSTELYDAALRELEAGSR